MHMLVVAPAALMALGSSLAAQATLFVDPAGSDVTGTGSALAPYRTIGFAAGAASSGDTLSLSPGTYGDDDQIILGSKDLTIAGAGTGVTIVRPHATLLQTQPTGFLPGTPTDHNIAIAVDGAGRVDIRDLTIDCAFRIPASGRLHGLYYRNGADGVVDSVEICNVRANPLNTMQGPAALLVRGDSMADPCEVTVQGCRIRNFGKVGIVGVFNASLEIAYNQVRASGPVSSNAPAQVGIQVGPNAGIGPPPVANIHHNEVADADYLVVGGPNQYAATGILLFDAGPDCRIEANDVTRCEDGIVVAQTSPGMQRTFVRRNSVTGAIYRAMRVDNTRGVFVENNTLHLANVLPLWGAAYDNSAGTNTWFCNNYSDWDGLSPTYSIPGGTNTDIKPRRDCDGFGAQVLSLPTGGLAQDVIVADIDGLNRVDIVSVDQGLTPSLTIARERGLAAVQYDTTTVPFGPTTAGSVALAAGEFNGLGGTDLVALTRTLTGPNTEDRFYIFINDGSGVFTLVHSRQITGAISPTDVAVGDLDGNGIDDLVISHSGGPTTPGGWTSFLNGGTPSSWLRTLVPLTTASKGIALGRLDAGPSLDVAVIEGDTTSGVVRLYTNDGAGTFTEVALGPIGVAPDPTAVTMFDINGDNRSEVLVACAGVAPAPPRPVQSSVVFLRNSLPASMPRQFLPVDDTPVAITTGNAADDDDPDTRRRDAMVLHRGPRTATWLSGFGRIGPTRQALCLLDSPNTVPAAAVLANVDSPTAFQNFVDLVVADAGAPGRIVIFTGDATAREDLYSQPCPGTGGRVPLIAPASDPLAGEAAVAFQGNNTFGVRLTNARPGSLALLLISGSPFVTLGCGLAVGLFPPPVVVPRTTDATGSAFLTVPIPDPPSAAFHGVFFYNQWAIVDPEAPPLLGVTGLNLALTKGLKVRIGG
ncbi:MAG: FG-GAP-like repeat-containing protein [Planctomycetota bacterium]